MNMETILVCTPSGCELLQERINAETEIVNEHES